MITIARKLGALLLLLPGVLLLMGLLGLSLEGMIAGERMYDALQPPGAGRLRQAQIMRSGDGIRYIRLNALLPAGVTQEAYVEFLRQDGWEPWESPDWYRKGAWTVRVSRQGVTASRDGREVPPWAWMPLAFLAAGSIPGLGALLWHEPAWQRIAGAAVIWTGLTALTITSYCEGDRHLVEGLGQTAALIWLFGLFVPPFLVAGGPGAAGRRIGMVAATLLAGAASGFLTLLGLFCHFSLW